MRTMHNGQDDLEPIEPSTARELFVDHKAMDCAEATVRNHSSQTKFFVQFCASEGIENLNNLTGRHIQQYRHWRASNFDLNLMTLKNNMSSLRVFLQYLASIEGVSQNLYDKVMVPRVDPEDRQRDEYLDSDDASEALDHLSKFRYASLEHVIFAILWETGVRMGSALALDVDDVYVDERYLDLKHRPDRETPLKNGSSGERQIAISPELSEVLSDYLGSVRHDVTDDFDRDPLLATEHGRISGSALRRSVYKVTAPCFRGDECPGCGKEDNYRCNRAVSPHDVRRGSITHYLTEDVPIKVVSDRMNVSPDVLEKHYDCRSEDVKMEQRRGYIDDI